MSLRLDLHRSLIDEMTEHALEVYPQESCGFIVGTDRSTSRVLRLANTASDPRHTFNVAPPELLCAFKEMERRGETLLAVYHSHPCGAPVPSEDDLVHAARHYPQIPQVIVGLRPNLDVRAWIVGQDQPQQVQIVVREDDDMMSRSRLTSVQVVAMLLAVLLSLLIFFAISLSLLPPAPSIPTPAG